MNELFSFQRFGWLMKKTLMERLVQILGTAGIIFFTTWLGYHINRPIVTTTNMSYNDDFQITAFSFGLVLGGGILAGLIFAYFSESAKGYAYLTLPASYFEKWLCGLTIMAVFTLTFLAFFRMMDIAYINHYHNAYLKYRNNVDKGFHYFNILSLNVANVQLTYIFFALLTGSMAVGAFYFNKMAIIKTAIACIVVFIAVQLLNSSIANTVFGQKVNSNIFSTRVSIVQDDYFSVILPNLPSIFFQYLLLLILPVALWLIALIRLREKEF